jgi:hypothetical protein
MSQKHPEFADHVRVRRTDLTERVGIADAEGQVYGWTTPSITGVDVIGPCPDDRALNVRIEATDSTYWLAPDLVEFLDHAVRTEARIGTSEWVRNADGSWKHRNSGPVGWIRRIFR